MTRRRLQSVVVPSGWMQFTHEDGQEYVRLRVSRAAMTRLCEQPGDLHSIRLHVRRRNSSSTGPARGPGAATPLVARLWCGKCHAKRAHKCNGAGMWICQACGCYRDYLRAKRKEASNAG